MRYSPLLSMAVRCRCWDCSNTRRFSLQNGFCRDRSLKCQTLICSLPNVVKGWLLKRLKSNLTHLTMIAICGCQYSLYIRIFNIYPYSTCYYAAWRSEERRILCTVLLTARFQGYFELSASMLHTRVFISPRVTVDMTEQLSLKARLS